MSDYWLEANWDAPANIRAGTTIRQFGTSPSPFDKGNLALHVGDDETRVLKNREFLKKSLDLPSEPFWLEQTHSTNVLNLDKITSDNHADASYCNSPNQVLCVLTADCLPILLCNNNGREISAVHAGWRGLAKGIIKNSINCFHAPANSMLAWIGPAIGQKNYEIGEEVREQMLQTIPESNDCFQETKPHHYLMDLAKLAELHLRSLGIHNVFQSNLCSYTDHKRFYSYRRDGITGRMATLIWRAES